MSGIIGMSDWEKHQSTHSMERLRSKSRKQELVKDRIKVARDLRSQGMTLQQIGDMLDRDHSTIIHYLNHEVF